MGQNKVSFEIAKILKEVGYPQSQCSPQYKENGELENGFTDLGEGCYYAPTYLDVWLWLWRKGRFKISLDECLGVCVIYDTAILDYRKNGDIYSFKYTDPEKSIIAAIDYLVENDLIK